MNSSITLLRWAERRSTATGIDLQTPRPTRTSPPGRCRGGAVIGCARSRSNLETFVMVDLTTTIDLCRAAQVKPFR